MKREEPSLNRGGGLRVIQTVMTCHGHDSLNNNYQESPLFPSGASFRYCANVLFVRLTF